MKPATESYQIPGLVIHKTILYFIIYVVYFLSIIVLLLNVKGFGYNPFLIAAASFLIAVLYYIPVAVVIIDVFRVKIRNKHMWVICCLFLPCHIGVIAYLLTREVHCNLFKKFKTI